MELHVCTNWAWRGSVCVKDVIVMSLNACVFLCVCDWERGKSTNLEHKIKRVFLKSSTLSSNPEHVRGEASNPRVQGSSHSEVSLHPSPLWDLQSRLGLANFVGNLLCGHHRALQCVFHSRGRARWREQCPPKPAQRQWHPSRDPVYFR